MNYRQTLDDLRELLREESDPIARMATIVALLKERHAKISWVGYYRRLSGEMLVLGPFQGPAACLRIAVGRGVCGTAAARREPLVVPDVNAFPGHIACDPRARSELVLPVDEGGELQAILDLDSYEPAAFDATDVEGLEPIARLTFPARRA
ncbi:MAG: GAF domain-containing protein [Candidatus Eisenbacteria bacterium]|nr:GAF domain-containing protein [Candidatus Eisenbacteria bacterium]